MDAAQLVRFEPFAGATWADVGSGAGLPGVVIACLVEGPVTLLEPRRLRFEFLRETTAALGLTATVECAKVEQNRRSLRCRHWSRSGAAREVPRNVPPPVHRKDSLGASEGRRAQSELAEVERAWQGVFHVEPSATDADSWIVVGTGVRAKTR